MRAIITALFVALVLVAHAPATFAEPTVTGPTPNTFTLNPGDSASFDVLIQAGEFQLTCTFQQEGTTPLTLTLPPTANVDADQSMTVSGSVAVPAGLAAGNYTAQFAAQCEDKEGEVFDFTGLTLSVQVTAPPPGPSIVTFDFVPRTLNLMSRGQVVTGFLEPQPPLTLADLDISSLVLGGSVSPEEPINPGDHDDDGIPDLMMKFPRSAVISTIGSPGASTEVTVAGHIDGQHFEAMDYVRTLWVGDQIGVPGSALTFTTYAVALEKDYPELEYDAADLPPGATFDAQTTEFSWTPSPADLGTRSQVLFSIQGPGFEITESVAINVGTVPVELSVFRAD
jgi:hypothetical protein